VTITGAPQLTLETGTTDAVVDYVSGSGTNTLLFNYSVLAAHSSADLDYQSTAALSANGGTIRDAAGNTATLTLPALAGVNSIAGQKALVIQTVAPTVTYASIAPTSPGSSRTPTVTMTLSTAATVTLYSENTCNTAISGATSLLAGAGQTITTASLTANGSTTIHAKAVAANNNPSACTSLVTYTHDNVAPTIVSFDKASGQGSSTNSTPINFTLTFSEPISAELNPDGLGIYQRRANKCPRRAQKSTDGFSWVSTRLRPR
jgi:hypothetical protein